MCIAWGAHQRVLCAAFVCVCVWEKDAGRWKDSVAASGQCGKFIQQWHGFHFKRYTILAALRIATFSARILRKLLSDSLSSTLEHIVRWIYCLHIVCDTVRDLRQSKSVTPPIVYVENTRESMQRGEMKTVCSRTRVMKLRDLKNASNSFWNAHRSASPCPLPLVVDLFRSPSLHVHRSVIIH